jgi:hypothetical protein
MVKMRTLRSVLLIAFLAMVVNMALSDVTFAKHDRGRGRFTGRRTRRFIDRHDGRDGRFDGRRRFNDKKAEKFINGHDARDGRFDGRGPRHRFYDRRGRGRR